MLKSAAFQWGTSGEGKLCVYSLEIFAFSLDWVETWWLIGWQIVFTFDIFSINQISSVRGHAPDDSWGFDTLDYRQTPNSPHQWYENFAFASVLYLCSALFKFWLNWKCMSSNGQQGAAVAVHKETTSEGEVLFFMSREFEVLDANQLGRNNLQKQK